MSPYLFVICMETWSCLIAEMVEDNKWKPIHVSREGPCISHLFFYRRYPPFHTGHDFACKALSIKPYLIF